MTDISYFCALFAVVVFFTPGAAQFGFQRPAIEDAKVRVIDVFRVSRTEHLQNACTPQTCTPATCSQPHRCAARRYFGRILEQDPKHIPALLFSAMLKSQARDYLATKTSRDSQERLQIDTKPRCEKKHKGDIGTFQKLQK